MNSKQQIISIGEVLWDILPDKKYLGGAPLNFSYYCKKLGLHPHIISAVGNDDLGKNALNKIQSLGLNTNFIHQVSFPTGKTLITLDDGQPDFEIIENVAWDNLKMTDTIKNIASKTNVVYFGTLANRSKKNQIITEELFSLAPKDSIKVLDVNLRKNYYSKELLDNFLRIANILKLTNEELEIISNLFNWGNANEKALLKMIFKKYNLNLIILTKGPDGSILFDGETIDERETCVTNIADTVGAGDSFLAAILYGLLNNYSLKKTHLIAAKIASVVCSQNGGMVKINNIKTILS